MHTKTLFAAFALAATVVALPVAQEDKKSDLTHSVDNILGSPFGNLNNNGNNNGNNNQFGNGNNFGVGNTQGGSGHKVRRSETLGTYVGNTVDSVTVPLNPNSPNTIIASPAKTGTNSGNKNSAGSNNDGNGRGNGANNGDNNLNNNSVGSGNTVCVICKPVNIDVDPSLTVG